ncbi:MAG: hypothetical protein ACFFDM_07880 [Candidatus Thorarchaeota archaeon]
MRQDIMKAISIVLLLLASSIPIAIADNRISIPEHDNGTIQPLVVWNYTRLLTPRDFCVADDGTVFAVNVLRGWELVRSPTIPAEFVAFSDTGELLWIKNYFMHELALFGVTTDDTHVFATGLGVEGLFVGKYDFDGNSIWNYTHDFGELGSGVKISVSEEGYVIVCTSWVSSFFKNFEYAHLVVLNPDGEYLWHKSFQDYAFVDCDSHFIYILQENVLEKYGMDESLVWSVSITEERRVTAHNDILFCYQLGELLCESILMVEGWNPHSGGRTWSSTMTLYNSENQVFNITDVDSCTTQDESLVLLFARPMNRSRSWHLLMVNDNGLPIRYFSILDESWYSALCKSIDSGQIIVVGTSSETDFTVAVYDSSGPEPPYDLAISESVDYFLIGITLIGVIVFDTSLIIILKRRYTQI